MIRAEILFKYFPPLVKKPIVFFVKVHQNPSATVIERKLTQMAKPFGGARSVTSCSASSLTSSTCMCACTTAIDPTFASCVESRSQRKGIYFSTTRRILRGEHVGGGMWVADTR